MDKVYLSRKFLSGWTSLIRKFVFRVLQVGPIPSHIAVIMDGNRRYAKKNLLDEGAGHDAGAMALLQLIIYSYELGVKFVTAYAFSIDNFRRKPNEVQKIMDLLRESITLLTRISKHQPIRVHFAGNLELLERELRDNARKLMEATVGNTKFVVTICVCYTCSDEIVHAVKQSCQENLYGCDRIRDGENLYGCDRIRDYCDESLEIKLVDIEKHMYMAVTPDPDILIRTGDETRLSNFLQWQTCHTHLASLSTVWPELGLWHLTWVILDFQQNYYYLAKKKKQL